MADEPEPMADEPELMAAEPSEPPVRIRTASGWVSLNSAPATPASTWGAHWKGDWSAIATYVTDDVVKYSGGYYKASKAASAGVVPGAAEPVMYKTPAHTDWTAFHLCKRITTKGNTPFTITANNEAGADYFYFDVTTAGTIVLTGDSTCYYRMYDATGTILSPNGNPPLDFGSCPVGRYYVQTFYKSSNVTGNFSFTGTAVFDTGPIIPTWQATTLPASGGGGIEFYEQLETPDPIKLGAIWLRREPE